MSDGWQVEPHPVPEALGEGFHQTRYGDDDYRKGLMVPVLEKLNQASLEVLSAVLGGWPIVPSDD